jgi:uncharacterized protein (UPF0335 family)
VPALPVRLNILPVAPQTIIDRVLRLIMPRLETVEQELSALSADLTDALARVEVDIEDLRRQVQEAGVDEAAVDRISGAISGLRARLQAVDPDPSNPSPANRPPDPSGVRPPLEAGVDDLPMQAIPDVHPDVLKGA